MRARGTAWHRPLLMLAARRRDRLLPADRHQPGDRERQRISSGTWRDLAWIVPFLCYAWAALEAPPLPLSTEPTTPQRALPIVASAVPVFLIPLIGYGWLHVQPLGDAGDSFRSLLTSLLTVGGLGLLTLRLVAQGDELQRADAQAKLLAAATEQTGDLILITRADGAFEHANDAFLRALGYSRQELARPAFPDLIERGIGAALGSHHGSVVGERGHLARHTGAPAAGRLDISRVLHGRGAEGSVERR